MMLALFVIEGALAAGGPEALVQVAAVAVFIGEGLRHEAGRHAIEQANLLDAVAEEQRAVGGFHSSGMAKIHLIHAFAMLAVITLHWHSVGVHQAAQLADEKVVASGTVDDIAACRRAERCQIAPLLLAQRPLILAPEPELQDRKS